MKNLPEWLKEWKEFNGESPEKTDSPLSLSLRNQIEKDLNPKPAFVFFHLLGIHALAGALSLIVCPQMGLGGAFGEFSLMNLFMVFGTTACFFFCGAFFVSTSLIAAFVFLEKDSLKMITRKKWLFLPGMLGFSFVVLKMLSLNLNQESSDFLSHDLPWMAGALLIGFLLIKFQENSDLMNEPLAN
ncbi:hypothetical protein GW916_15005 [bacterium]|nr:hypothetical protein [bacterium]